MSMRGTVFLLVVLVAAAQAYTYRWHVEVVDNQCIDANVTRSDGEKWYNDEECERYTCEAHSGLIQAVGCGVTARPEQGSPCSLVPGKGHYPQCCPHVVCDWDKQSSV